jgi:Mg2+ and Co2+ transporter CorA
VSLERRLFKTTSLLGSTTDVLDELASLDSVTVPGSAHLYPQVKNHRRQCGGNIRTATFLEQRARITAQLLADTLALRDQVISKEQGASMLQLNKSAVFITTLGLVYLPASFVAVSVPSNYRRWLFASSNF